MSAQKPALAAVTPAPAAAVSPAVSQPGAVAGGESVKLDMRYLIRAMIKYNASDLHLRVGRPPLYRINGKLIPAKMPELSLDHAKTIIYSILTSKQIRDLEEKLQIDVSFHVEEFGRFRCNVYFQRHQVTAAIRAIPLTAPQLDDLGVPPVVKEICTRPRGLFLVTGATGSGKSTTLAAIIQYLNEHRHCHILSVEDPIEFVYRDLKATISQRELGTDAHSVKDALHAALRQDPDVIMIGEMRDMETIQATLTAAETGHLVLSTLHTNDAKSTIERIVDVFPPEARGQIRMQLASTLLGVCSQQLIPRPDGEGRVLAAEVLIRSPMIEDLILKNEIEKITEVMENSSSYYKMQTMNQHLERLVKLGHITQEAALKASSNPDDLKLKFSGFTHGDGGQSG